MKKVVSAEDIRLALQARNLRKMLLRRSETSIVTHTLQYMWDNLQNDQ